MKHVTYAPRKGGLFRLQIDGKMQPGKEALLTKSQVLMHGLELLADGQVFSIGRASEKNTPPKKQTVSKHPSKYDRKQRK